MNIKGENSRKYLYYAIRISTIFKQISHLDATVSQVYYLTFMCGSTCFGRLHAYHQELTTALAASGFTAGVWWQQHC